MAYHTKPDLRVLFKLFSLAAVRRERQGDTRLGKFDAQSTPMIAIGQCPNSNGPQFYNPSNGTFVSSIIGMKYQPGIFIYRIDESNSIFGPQFSLDSKVYVHTHSPPSVAKVIRIPNYNTPDVYTVVFPNGSISEYTSDILSATTQESSKLTKSLLPSWIKRGANATLFLNDMAKPRHGSLNLVQENWMFYPGKSTDGIILPVLEANCQMLLDTGQLFKGHAKFRNVYDARNCEYIVPIYSVCTCRNIKLI